ncbi:hypothetical protein D0T12_21775 [Actinomadura spongiicola]|uniref:Uncharacterized protein n=1 Tax=Actinomadura spongiicola TaxID=2303421 RepID=A0A372GE38_9ACTN|nr:hypothetical protein [Actinomadura spongiicola]RFS83651.1 hypothetical protein D0T12_21775 [Actinomadura spongiicola]
MTEPEDGMTKHGDRGISIGGNAHVSGMVATGDNVTQNQQVSVASSGDAAAVLERIERIERLLDQYAAEVPELDRARRDLADVREEAESDDADPERVEGALERLGRRVGGVAVLAEAVGQLGAAMGVG